MTTDAVRRIDTLLEQGVLLPIDAHFGRLLARLCPTDDGWVPVAGALCSRAVQVGHVCLDLRNPAPLLDARDEVVELELPSLEHWRRLLESSPAASDGSRPTPLVWSPEGRLYLQRYWSYEQRLARALRVRVHDPIELDERRVEASLERHFGPDQASDNEQRRAVSLALHQRLAVISGGPGTGKTWTVTKLLLALEELALEKGAVLRIALLAPTGKAAHRLSESISRGLADASMSEAVRAALPTEASTIHRALGYQPRTPTRFQRNARNPLPHDVVIVDEASMVDLALMTKLAEAVAQSARLILLGDKDQLASVEAGAIFGDILRAPVQNCSVHLSRSRRYAEASGIGRLAFALREGDPTLARRALDAGMGANLVELSGHDLRPLEAAIERRFQEYGNAASPEDRLVALDRFRLLSAHRSGPRGVVALNALCERVLGRSTRLTPKPGPYAGRPILITSNDYNLELWNGDVGVLGPSLDGTRLQGYFRREEGIRTVPLSRLPSHETVFAMTVHKSQGSEFDGVAVVLPEQPSPLLTRELLYTAVTRARTEVTLFGSHAMLSAGMANGLRRTSGLAERLGG